MVNFDGLLNSETRWRAGAAIPHRRVGASFATCKIRYEPNRIFTAIAFTGLQKPARVYPIALPHRANYRDWTTSNNISFRAKQSSLHLGDNRT